ncbi:flavin containing amine oxidase [Aeromonas phage ZPAH1]|nr:flavin containing amine oxidase [Aeromonas phage ZPAH1]
MNDIITWIWKYADCPDGVRWNCYLNKLPLPSKNLGETILFYTGGQKPVDFSNQTYYNVLVD